MEPWIEAPSLLNLNPGQTIFERCKLHVPRGEAQNVVWRLQYGPSWMHLDPQTGVLSGTVPADGLGGKFLIDADFEYLVGAPGKPPKPPKAPKPPKPPAPAKTQTYAHYRDKFVNSISWDDEAFDRMLDQVGLERDIRDILKPARGGPQWRWVLVGALMAAVPALLAAILMLMVV